MKSSVGIIFMVIWLIGCSSNADKLIAKAESEPDPTKALAIIRQTEEYYKENPISNYNEKDRLLQAEDKYFTLAAKSGNEHVLRELFEYRSGKWVALQDELQPNVLERAKTTNNPDLLAAAAAIYGNNKVNVINTSERVNYLMRAWKAGDKPSAGLLSHHFVRLKDYDSAYLWSLRCIRDCDREKGIEQGEYINQIKLGELEKHLNNVEIINIQKEAAIQPAKK